VENAARNSATAGQWRLRAAASGLEVPDSAAGDVHFAAELPAATAFDSGTRADAGAHARAAFCAAFASAPCGDGCAASGVSSGAAAAREHARATSSGVVSERACSCPSAALQRAATSERASCSPASSATPLS
jgi:hypothetical protein